MFDAHFHYPVCIKNKIDVKNVSGISCALNPDEFEIQKSAPDEILKAYAIHPMAAADCDIVSQVNFIENLLKENLICAVGECGFDYFTPELKASKNQQHEAFESQLFLAKKYQKPLIIHCRKANDELFAYSKELKKLPAVLFHSFMGSVTEMQSFLKRGVNGFFSFGKPLLNNNKKAIECVKNIPLENLMLETDSPYQTLKGEKFTFPSEIRKVYEAAFKIRFPEKEINYCDEDFGQFCKKISFGGFIKICKGL